MTSASEQPRLILGSASPRRAELMRQLDLTYTRIVSPEEEPVPDGHRPEEFVLLSAGAKARAVDRLVRERNEQPAIVIGADTVVCLEDRILGKPTDAPDAAAMLRDLSGRDHQVYTGLALILPDGGELRNYAATLVRMCPLSAADIAWYVASGEPLDKAGAYGIQGLGGRFIERIEGCYYNVVGLPLVTLSRLLREAGYRFHHSQPEGGR